MTTLFLLNSCVKRVGDAGEELKKDSCPTIEENLNIAGQRLPVAISYIMPSTWQKTESTNSMKFEERVIDPISQAKIKVFYFEGMKNMTEANIERWKNQFKKDGFKLEVQELVAINKVPVVKFKASGTYIEKTSPMNPDSESIERPGHTMQAFIVETQTGTWFFKAVAPSSVIDKEAIKLEQLEQSIRESY